MINRVGVKFISTIIWSILLSNIAFAKECFRIGEYWHDLILPDGMTNVRWLFGDDEKHFPFMSVSFNVDDKLFDTWAKDCGVSLRKSGVRRFWDKDVDSGGFVSVIKYENYRYCIGVIRTPIPEEKRHVDGRDYYACPLDTVIDY